MGLRWVHYECFIVAISVPNYKVLLLAGGMDATGTVFCNRQRWDRQPILNVVIPPPPPAPRTKRRSINHPPPTPVVGQFATAWG